MAQPLFVLPIAVALVLTLSVVALSAQFQPIVPDIGFEVEGNIALDQGGDFDWENAVPPAVRILDPNSRIETDPTTFKPNSKFEDPAGWSIMPARVGPGQSELVNFLVWDIPPGDLGGGRPDDHWLVLGMERIKTPGFFEMDFEYNQAAWDGSSGGLTRTPGDVLVGFELRGKPTSKKASFKVLLLQYLPGAQPSLCNTKTGPGGEPESVDVGTQHCPPYGDSGWYYRLLADDALTADSGLVQATMNTEPILVPLPTVTGNDIPFDVISPYEFAEAAINLTALGIEPDCEDPGTVHAKSRSAFHVHSDLKDLVGPVRLTKCELGRLDGHKFLDVDGDGLWDQDEPPLECWEIMLSDGSVTHTDAAGYYAFENLDYGTYTVSEACPQGEDWVQTLPTPDDPNSCGEAVYTVQLDYDTPVVNDLDFGNHWPSARLDGYKFHDFAGQSGDPNGIWDPGEPPIAGWEIRLSDGSVTHTNAEGYYAFEDLEYGTYTVSEVCPQEQDGCWRQTAPELLADCTCGDAVYTVELSSGTPERNHLDFGNSWTTGVRLSIGKDAQTSFTRTYQWTLEKTVDDPGPIPLNPGEYADVQYEVAADSTYVDSWTVEGTITIQNLGGASVRLASLTDVITPGDIEVPFDCGGVEIEDVILDQLEILTCSYGPVQLPDGAARTNTATLTVQDSAEEWIATVPIVFSPDPTEIDEAATVTDTNWEDEQWEGPEGFGIGAGDTPWIKQYPSTFYATGQLCKLLDYPNTATLVTNDTGTELTAEANVQIREACQAQVTIAYEDLRYPEEENDWDYNDLLVHLPISLTVSEAGDLEAVSFKATVDPLRTAFSHTINLQPYDWFCDCIGTYTKVVTDSEGTTTTGGPYNPGDSLLLVPNTRDAGNDTEFLVELTIDFTVEEPGCPYDYGDPNPIEQYHGEWLFFDPWITVYRPDLTPPGEPITTYEIHVGHDSLEPRILTVPADWVAPEQDWVPIWDVYCETVGAPDVMGDPPIFTPLWWNGPICTQ
jgi:hypothetical protein